jgi:hypothetical protein
MSELLTTPGPWIVKPAECQGEGTYIAKVISLRPASNEGELVALVLSMGDAALIASAREMLEALIAIQETLNHSKKPIDLVSMNQMISDVFEKIAAESGEL